MRKYRVKFTNISGKTIRLRGIPAAVVEQICLDMCGTMISSWECQLRKNHILAVNPIDEVYQLLVNRGAVHIANRRRLVWERLFSIRTNAQQLIRKAPFADSGNSSHIDPDRVRRMRLGVKDLHYGTHDHSA